MHKRIKIKVKNNRYFVISLLILIFASIGTYLILSSKASPTIAADFNSDGTVNVFDLSLLASNWNRAGATNTTGDANNDGTVNIFDLSILANQWGQTATPSLTPTPTPTPTPSATPVNAINIKTVYGAKGDGVADDTTAINNAIAAVKSGQTLYFPLGDYKYSGKYITPPDGVTLLGQDTGTRRSYIMAGVVFGSNQNYKNLLFGKLGYYGITHKNNFNATNTVFDNCRFRGGGQIGTSTYYYSVAQFGGKDYQRSLSRVTFNDSEFERNLLDWVSPTDPRNTISLWEDNRAGNSHIEYLTFNRTHFSVKNPSGKYGAVNANIEFKTNSWSQYSDFSHNWHNLVIKDSIFEKSGTFNIDLTDSARDWNEAHTGSRSQTTYTWNQIPMQVHAGWETGRALTLTGTTVKGAGEMGTWAYVLCLENPIFNTVTGNTMYGGARTSGGMISASWEAGPWRSTPLPNYSTPVTTYDLSGMNYETNNNYTPGVWGSYTPSPYDP